ncbi:acyltransferase domain-containing protein [Streptomyces rishiriensis]|uniref:acyltransferase domain-containing protein n=1 Tax=Streptomyces rishiriensis TaxID=68264 RepID=UPI000D58EA49|nr:acyltransferase domain-containing protein [Streptomyces rishiriensis]
MLPNTDELAEVLLDLAVPHQDLGEAVRLSRHVTRDAESLRILDKAVTELVQDMGRIRGTTVDIPALPDPSTATARFFPLYVFVAALPHIRAHHRERGIPDDVSRHTLADVGRCVAWHRRWHGTGGLLIPQWLTLHFHGELYQLGRLQFQRGRIGRRTGASIAAAGLPQAPGDHGLSVHVPDFMGPLTPQAVERSLTLARAFFARHYPEETYSVATCASWLLDPQLKRRLPNDSNIVRFQERFHPVRVPTDPEAPQAPEASQAPDDMEAVRFVFGTTDVPLDELPRRTVLQRAVLDHLREGGHWYVGRGWFEL